MAKKPGSKNVKVSSEVAAKRMAKNLDKLPAGVKRKYFRGTRTEEQHKMRRGKAGY